MRNTDAIPMDDYAQDNDAIAADRRIRDFKPVEGPNEIRILPLRGRGKYYRIFSMHFGVGPENRSIPCPNKTAGEGGSCAVCQYVGTLYDGSAADQDVAKRIRAKDRYVSAILPMGAKKIEPMSWPYGIQVFQGIEEVRNIAGIGNIFHPESGRSLTLTLVKKGKEKYEVEYRLQPTLVQSPITDLTYLDRALEIVDNYLQFPDQDEIRDYLKTATGKGGNTPAARPLAMAGAPTRPAFAAAPTEPTYIERSATEPQIKAIYAIARGAQNMDDGELEEFVEIRFGCLPTELNRRQASELIDTLKLGAAVPAPRPVAKVYPDGGDALPSDDEEDDEYEQEHAAPAPAPRATAGSFAGKLRKLAATPS